MFGHAAFLGSFQVGMDDISAGQRLRGIMRGTGARQRDVIILVFGQVRDYSSPSYRLIGPPGMMVEIACL
jgi:hypothetical protein